MAKGTTILDKVGQLQEQATSEYNTAVEQLMAAAQTVADAFEVCNQLGVEEVSNIDLSVINFVEATEDETPKPRKRRRSSKASTDAPSTANVRGSKPMPLGDAILVVMNAGEKGHDFTIQEILDGVQGEPINYNFSGNPDNWRTQISGRLGTLKGDGMIKSTGRGQYAVLAAGRKAAKAALETFNAPAESASEG